MRVHEMKSARSRWTAAQTGYTGEFRNGKFLRWKLKQGGRIARTDWTAASLRWQSMQTKRTLHKKVVVAHVTPKPRTRIRMLTAKELLKKRNDTWKNTSNTMSARIVAYKAANPRSRRYSKAGLMQKIKAYDASGTVENINKNLTAATDAYQANPNRATAHALKTWVSVRQGRAANTRSRRTSAAKYADRAALLASSATENAARKNLADAFSKGLVARDKGGFFDAVTTFGKNIAIPLAVGGAGIIAGVGAVGALAATAAPAAAAAGGVDIVATGSGALAADVAGLATMASAGEAQAIIAGQALANSIGAGLTGAAAQAAAAITQAGVGSLAAGALAAVPSLAVGTVANVTSSGLFNAIKSTIQKVGGKEIARIQDQIANLSTLDAAATAATTGVGNLIADKINQAIKPAAQVIATQPGAPVIAAQPAMPVIATKPAAAKNNKTMLSLAAVAAAIFFN